MKTEFVSHVSATTPNWLMLFRVTIAVYCEKLVEHTQYTVWVECRVFIYKNSVRTSQETHYVSTTEPNWLILFRVTIATYCQNRIIHIYTLCEQNARF
jgi:hypothetical protein